MLRTPPGPGALLQACIDPLVAIATLGAVVSFFGGRFDGACLILALLVFAMTFPGSFAKGSGTRAGDLALDIAAGWLAIVGLLLFLGWASRTLEVFDSRVILAWALATPAALFAAHRLMPVVWPRVLAAEGMQKTAVIAGANDLGRKLAVRLRENPLLGMRFAGYFDDRAPGRLQNIMPRENLGSLRGLADYARANPVDVIYIALPMASQPRILKLLVDLRDTTASIYFVPDIFVSDLIQARVDSIGGLPGGAHKGISRTPTRGSMIRHKVKPGITGLAQVNGFRGETDTVEKMKARIDYDLAYLRNWSLLLDLQIILKTIVVVLQKQNAY